VQTARTVTANTVVRLNQSSLAAIFLRAEFRVFFIQVHSVWSENSCFFFFSSFFYGTDLSLYKFCLNEEELEGMCARLKLARCIRDLTNLLADTVR